MINLYWKSFWYFNFVISFIFCSSLRFLLAYMSSSEMWFLLKSTRHSKTSPLRIPTKTFTVAVLLSFCLSHAKISRLWTPYDLIFFKSLIETACFVSIYCFNWTLASQILMRPSSPPVTIMTVLRSRLKLFVTLMQLMATPACACSLRTKYLELQYVEMSPKLFPNTTSLCTEWPSRYEMKSMQSKMHF